LGAAFAQANADDSAKPPGAIRVAVYDDTGVGKGLRELIKVLDGFSDVRYDRIKADDIRGGRLADYDVLIHPGAGSRGFAVPKWPAVGPASLLGNQEKGRARKWASCLLVFLSPLSYLLSLHPSCIFSGNRIE
jgi:hypothetical protein